MSVRNVRIALVLVGLALVLQIICMIHHTPLTFVLSLSLGGLLLLVGIAFFVWRVLKLIMARGAL